MKLICLNIWGGRAGKEGLLAFFEKYRDTTDIFCLQEVWADKYENLEGSLAGGVPINNSLIMTQALQEISAVLPNHVAYFRPSFLGSYGLCTYVRKGVKVLEEGDVFVHLEREHIIPEGLDVGTHARNLQYVSLKNGATQETIMNFHGLWNGRGKSNTPERIVQSERIIEFLRSRNEPFVLVGDFNLTPETESLKMLEYGGIRNLVTELGITSTRTNLYAKPGKHANYVFVSPGITVRDFKVLPDEVSDHAPLYLDFE